MSLADYLAKNYLTADSDKKSKKRKRKDKDGGLKIKDDDIFGWDRGKDDNDDDGPTIASMTLAARKSKKTSQSTPSTGMPNWTSIGVAAPSHAQQLAADEAAANAIINTASADRLRAAEAEDEAPEMVDTEGVLTESGMKAGLQTGAQLAAAMAKKQEQEAKRRAEATKDDKQSETIYRDATGKIINVALKRAEARKKAEALEREKREAEIAARGDVQNAEAAKRKQQLQDAKGMTLARYADDAELNDDLKEQGRWNDPAMGFLRKKKAGRSVTGKPLYTGAFQPNRYGIRPGHRWDGVNRGNGFESEWFKSRNRKADLEKMEYAWQMDE